MATHDYVIDNQSAPSLRADLNNALQAIVTQNSSATAPTTTYANMIWYDTANNQLKKRDEANSSWIILGTIEESLGTFTPSGERALASQAEAEAGVDDTTVMTPLRVEQHMTTNALGWGQTWQDVTASRAKSTSYQNTTGRPIFVSIDVTQNDGSYFFAVSTDNVNWLTIAGKSGNGNDAWVSGLVPDQYYYRLTGTTTITTWAELR